ncbi:sulfotransferase family protein [Eudoraea chungangensis]|uniref:sulfotransferase family protein n=1 Tax=Eudoraea chungangensis TaxID=1481905 RepID=UPI0023EB4D32|nr:sulfotransferase family protein [Eudoraea chungangensis]
MSLKIIGAGFGRTGTLSTQHALNELGYSCYHMKEITKKANEEHLDFWVKVAETSENAPHEWNKVFQNYSATIDYPSSCVWKELMEANPDAKVLLTLHPGGPEAWYKSTVDTIYGMSKMWESKLLSSFIPPLRKMTKMTSKLIWGRFLKGTMDNKQRAINRYNEHINEVTNLVPSEKLLVYSVNQGWEPLCKFLGLEVPKTDFPKVNDKEEMKKMIRLMSIITRAAIVIIVLFVIYLIWRIV